MLICKVSQLFSGHLVAAFVPRCIHLVDLIGAESGFVDSILSTHMFANITVSFTF